ncbi:MAG: NB-ARC domain-containing protein [Actinomycetota bacterium]|nr:NB-ARC domain-containing protein [Actinomycetota bacterium]
MSAARELPAGTVTFLFTDIEGSTTLLHELGDGYADALEDHRRRLRDAFTACDGVEGDAFFVAFARASDAARAALAGQQALDGSPLRVRMGLHTGEPLVRDEGYVGMDVHRAARVMSAGHGGQVVVSERTRALLDDDLPLQDLGVHRLKDLREPERLYQLGPGDFPPLRTLDATNLPITATQLLGRDRELEEVVALLSNGTRLLTVTGPGGTGKTRFALEACAEFVGRTKDGVHWVPLAGVPDPDLVLSEIAQVLGARDDLPGFLRDRDLLLLLDNFEHLLPAAPALSHLLAGSERLKVLVTSRAPLRVAGEHEYLLEPLAPADSVTLFCERARAIGRDLAPSETIDAICRRLDGLPLAIELAAARTKLLGPDTLLERLEHSLPLLTGGARDAPERQRTLRRTIEWSYALLDDGATRLFARLAVFAGSFSLVAAEEVCEVDLDALSALVDLSLLKAIGGDRFLLLETIREYASERLNELDNSTETQRRHATYFAALAEDAYTKRIGGEAEAAAQVALDHDDLRAAFDWLATTEPGSELPLAGALGWFWLSHSHLEEGARRLEQALESGSGTGTAAARALTAAGGIAGQTGRGDEARVLFSRAIEQWREVGDDAELGAALNAFGWASFFSGADDQSLQAFDEELELQRRRGDEEGETRALTGVCQLLVAQGQTEQAEMLSRDLLEMSRRSGDVRSEHFALHYLADCALMRFDYPEAEARYRDSLSAARALGDGVEISLEVQGVAMAASGKGDLERAARLAGAVDAFWESIGLVVEVPFWNALLERHIVSARKELGPEGETIWNDGRALTLDDAVDLALSR